MLDHMTEVWNSNEYGHSISCNLVYHVTLQLRSYNNLRSMTWLDDHMIPIVKHMASPNVTFIYI